MSKDPLDQLFVKPEEIEGAERATLSKMVFPFASIDPESGRIFMKPTFDDLSTKHKVLVYLLARLALSTRPNAPLPAIASPKEIEKGTGLPGGSVRPNLTLLVREHIVSPSGDGYLVPSASLRRALKELQSDLPQTDENK